MPTIDPDLLLAIIAVTVLGNLALALWLLYVTRNRGGDQ